MKRYVLENWLWIISGCILTRLAVDYAYLERGYKAVGGEWLVLPVILLSVHMARETIRSVIAVFQDGGNDE